jgi:hypothetical protein
MKPLIDGLTTNQNENWRNEMNESKPESSATEATKKEILEKVSVNKKALSPHQQVYVDHQKNFDEVLQNALLNIVWDGSPDDYAQKIDGNKISFRISNVYTLLVMAIVSEKKFTDKYRVYNWQVRCAILVNKTQRILREAQWTRKQRRMLINVGKAMMVGCGEKGTEAYEIINGHYIGTKMAGKEDKEIIEMVREAAFPPVEPEEPVIAKPKRTRKKKETAQNEPSTGKTTKRSRRVLPQLQEDVLSDGVASGSD